MKIYMYEKGYSRGIETTAKYSMTREKFLYYLNELKRILEDYEVKDQDDLDNRLYGINEDDLTEEIETIQNNFLEEVNGMYSTLGLLFYDYFVNQSYVEKMEKLIEHGTSFIVEGEETDICLATDKEQAVKELVLYQADLEAQEGGW